MGMDSRNDDLMLPPAAKRFRKFEQSRYATTTVWNRIYATAPAIHFAPTLAPRPKFLPQQAKKVRSRIPIRGCTARILPAEFDLARNQQHRVL